MVRVVVLVKRDVGTIYRLGPRSGYPLFLIERLVSTLSELLAPLGRMPDRGSLLTDPFENAVLN